MKPRSDRQMLSLVASVTMISIFGNTFLAPVIPDILDHFDRPDSAGGLLISANTLAGVFVAPVAGFLADRWGRRPVLFASLTVFGLFGVAAALAPTFNLLLAFRFGMGFGAAALINLAVVLIGDRFDGEDRVKWVGRNAGVLTIGLAIIPLISGMLGRLGGWRLPLMSYGLALPVALYSWWILDRQVNPDGPPLNQQLRDAGSVLQRPRLLVIFLAAAIAFAVIFGVFLGAVPTVLDNRFELGSLGRGIVLSVPAASSSLVAFNLSRINARFSRTTILVLGAGSWVVAFVLMGLTPWLWLFIVAAVVYGPGEGGMIPSLTNAALDIAPDKHRAVVMAVWTASARAGQTIGPYVAGLLIGYRQGSVSILLGAVGSIVLILLFVGANLIATRATPTPTASG